jgi:hypothetical protein
MRQATLFDEPKTKAAPIARASDPVTSHKAAEKIDGAVHVTQMQCLQILRDNGRPMTSNEIAQACCDRYCEDLKHHAVMYSRKLSNYRKRADEIKRNKDICEKLEEERNGSQLFRAREQT